MQNSGNNFGNQTIRLNLIKSLYKLAPVVFQWIGILELLPWARAVRTMDDRQVTKEVVFETQIS